MSCPFCDSADVELVSPFAGQIITSQFHCRACNTYFEAVRDDFEARNPTGPMSETAPPVPVGRRAHP